MMIIALAFGDFTQLMHGRQMMMMMMMMMIIMMVVY